MTSQSTIGPELEFVLINTRGDVVPKAPEILARNDNKYLFAEVLDQWVEVGAQQSHNIQHVVQDFIKNIDELINLSAIEGVVPLPLSTTVDRDFEFQYSSEYNSQRTIARANIFYSGLNYTAEDILGLHEHVDAHPNPEIRLRQRHALTALDIRTVLTASSPFFMGKIDGNDPRLGVQRYVSDQRFMILKELQEYFPTLDHYDQEIIRAYTETKSVLDQKKLPKIYAGVNPNKNVFGPNRVCDEDPKITEETRASGASLISNCLADIVLVKTVNDIVEHTPLVYGTRVESLYTINSDGFVIPTFEQLKNIEVAKQNGLRDHLVHRSLQNLYETVLSRVNDENSLLLQPLARILETKRNTSDDLLWAAQSNGHLDGNMVKKGAAPEIRLLYKEMMLTDFQSIKRQFGIPDYEYLRPIA